MTSSVGTRTRLHMTEPTSMLAVPPQLTTLPPLKFVVLGPPRIYAMPNDQVQTYQPYYLGKWTVIGAPLFSESLLTIRFKGKRLAIKHAIPRPQNLTVAGLVRILIEYMRQL
ncbi:hypothetical protein FN846DRAFT_912474 [Sphaerosporella brunnea]|uniref:Uncharacterized protein n=1 Tax=Sphaerosporella brunnea TaxID=1250544 RepID=A0A5J5EIA5_9PEZI|nr:hypothetical protein FN846DRAFT_912474 [Sphaerosporella brunnea]